ncbi:hypothetical protein CVU37_01820 [candidate division BRC1 bacterium HGW-BRC1-1]|jgi:hypothetical protein|nr:MAG: hypothetical protein CVU37_01820 [candidate division BRC1 bacterium HGW-BRC1-1]
MHKSIATAILAILSLSICAQAQDIIIESRPEGQNFQNYQELEGKWLDSNEPVIRAKSSAPGLSAQTIGARKVLFQIAGTSSTVAFLPTAARFFPKLSAPAKMNVYATWPSASNAMPVHYVIKHADGEETVDLIQDGWGNQIRGGNADQWVPLGAFNFNSGADQYVEIRTDAKVKAVGSAANTQYYSDAVRFTVEPLGPAAMKGAAPVSAAPQVAPGASTTPINWMFDITSAQNAAKTQKKRILLYFFLPGNAASMKVDDTLNSPIVRGIVNSMYIPVRMDFSQNSQMAYQLQIFKGGTIGLYESDGSPVMHITERLTADELAARLRVQ